MRRRSLRDSRTSELGADRSFSAGTRLGGRFTSRTATTSGIREGHAKPPTSSGTARDGKPHRNTYTWYMKMRDSRIVDVIAFFDSVEFNDFGTRVAPAAP